MEKNETQWLGQARHCACTCTCTCMRLGEFVCSQSAAFLLQTPATDSYMLFSFFFFFARVYSAVHARLSASALPRMTYMRFLSPLPAPHFTVSRVVLPAAASSTSSGWTWKDECTASGRISNPREHFWWPEVQGVDFPRDSVLILSITFTAIVLFWRQGVWNACNKFLRESTWMHAR